APQGAHARGQAAGRGRHPLRDPDGPDPARDLGLARAAAGGGAGGRRRRGPPPHPGHPAPPPGGEGGGRGVAGGGRAGCRATRLTPLTLHPRPGVKEEFMPWLEEAYPELVPDYRRLYRGSNAPRAVREEPPGRVQAEKRRHRTFASPTTPVTARRLPDPPPTASAPAPADPDAADHRSRRL